VLKAKNVNKSYLCAITSGLYSLELDIMPRVRSYYSCTVLAKY